MNIRYITATGAAASVLLSSTALAQAPNLFEAIGSSNAAQSERSITASQKIRVNRKALNSPTINIDLFGDTVTAVRTNLNTKTKGTTIWHGTVGNNPADNVVIVSHGSSFASTINYQGRTFEMTGSAKDGLIINELDVSQFPEMEPENLPVAPNTGDVGSEASGAPVMSGNAVQQDLLVPYTDKACVALGGTSGVDCSAIEARILAAVAQTNQSYVDSNINIFMNLVRMTEYVYDESGKDASTMLNELRNTGDGQLEGVHAERDAVGADLVGLVTQSGGGYCGIAWVRASASYAFSQQASGCLAGRTLAHELGHNQGSSHARSQASNPQPGDYAFGFRRCNNGGVDDIGSPYFKTIMAYSCTGAAASGTFSNPEISISGVPGGVDPDVDPNNAAFAARTLNESAVYVSGFRDAPATTVPNAPSGLSASATGFDAINLNWTDNANDEVSFSLDRSEDNASWANIATLGANTTSYSDNGLTDDTTYYYRVSAGNSAGSSAESNTASATTDAQPSTIDQVANGQILGNGTVSGGFSLTHASDGAVQTITEVSTGGPKRRRKQAYTHTWTFDVAPGAGGVLLTAEASVSGAEGANFAYSADGGASYNTMFSVNSNTPTSKSFTFPGGTSGNVRVRVTDAEQTNGEGADSVSVDYLVITSNTDVGNPPVAPSNMVATAAGSSRVDLSFSDNSEDEFGFEIYRSAADPGTDCNAGSVVGTAGAGAGTGSASYSDNSVAASSTYWYWAKAFNGAGDNGSCSNADSATTDAGPALTASGNGYKVKGRQNVDVSWSGATTNVDIYRSGNIVGANEANDGAYTDAIGSKGGGSYTYQVCETGSTSACSATFNIVF